MFICALKINRPLHLTTAAFLDDQILEKIVLQCDQYQHPLVYKSLYSLAFFSFLRISNLLPHSMVLFDANRQLCGGTSSLLHRELPFS